MNSKFILFVSGILTVFILLTLAGVITIVRQVSSLADPVAVESTQPPPEAADSLPASVSSLATPAPTQVPPPAQPALVVISAQDAANLASVALNRSDATSVEVVTYNGENVFKVNFGASDYVYVSAGGQILLVVVNTPTTQPTTVTTAYNDPGKEPPTKASRENNSGGELEDDGGGGDD